LGKRAKGKKEGAKRGKEMKEGKEKKEWCGG
jgi:hypothetical protein